MFEIAFYLSYIDIMNDFYEYLRKQGNDALPQLLGIMHEGKFHHFALNTFHLNERPEAFLKGLPQEHSHNVFHIVFYTAENEPNRFMLEGKPVESRALMMVLLPPGAPHCFAPLRKNAYSYHEITFSFQESENGNPFRGSFEELFEKYSGSAYKIPKCIEFSKSKAAFIERHYDRIAEALKKNRPDKLFHTYTEIASFIFFIMNELTSKETEKLQEASPSLLTAQDYIELNFGKKPGLEEIASAAGVSREHLCRAFRKHYGMSPVQYSNTLRISAAEQLLLNSSLSISEISSRLGFSDIYSFSKSFKKASGRPPGKFRSR